MSHEQTRLKISTDDGDQLFIIEDQESHGLTDILKRKGLTLNTRCGQRGICNGCSVELLDGALKHLDGTQTQDPSVVRGCQYQVVAGQTTSLHVPTRSLLSSKPQIVSRFKLNVSHAMDPLAKVSSETDLGIVIDIGTTTVAVILVRLSDGQVLAEASDFNKQMLLGDNVLTRINLCMTDETMIEELQRAIAVDTIAPLIQECLQLVGVKQSSVLAISIAANTTMQHLLVSVNPKTMGFAPFTPVFTEHCIYDAHQISLIQEPNDQKLPVHLLPSASAYIGADLVAGIISTGLAYDEGPCLLVDVGTNGEIIFKYNNQLLGCATAAGPAFEGAMLQCGCRAVEGAISHLTLKTEPTWSADCEIIGNVKTPIGLCGSAYIDFLAEAFRRGLLTHAGRFLEPCPEGYVVAYAQGKKPLVVKEYDISMLLQAKAAIAAGIITLMEHMGIKPHEVKKVYLAGGFGMHLNVRNAIDCGLLPGFTLDQIELVGNTSLAGAYMALLDQGSLDEMSKIANNLQIIELNSDPEFETRFIDQLMVPQ